METKTLDELMDEISTTYENGKSFRQVVFLGLTMSPTAKSRNEYIITLGKHIGIPTASIERVITLLPA